MIRYSLFVALFLPSILTGQPADTTALINRLQLGVGFGVMLHDIDFTPSTSTDTYTGERYNFGLRYFDNKLVGFQAEVSLTSAGWREPIDTLQDDVYERKITFAEVLILTQLSVGNGFIQPMLQAGPYISFPLSSAETLPPGFEVPDSNPPQYYGLDFPRRLNYGLVAGLGLNVEAGPVTVQLQGQYLVGFSDLFKTGTTVAATSRRQGLGGQVGMFWTL